MAVMKIITITRGTMTKLTWLMQETRKNEKATFQDQELDYFRVANVRIIPILSRLGGAVVSVSLDPKVAGANPVKVMDF
jgi:hypothetical protein